MYGCVHAAVLVMDISLQGSIGREKCSKAPLRTPLRIPKALMSRLLRLRGPRWASLGLCKVLQGDSEVVSEYATILELVQGWVCSTHVWVCSTHVWVCSAGTYWYTTAETAKKTKMDDIFFVQADKLSVYAFQ